MKWSHVSLVEQCVMNVESAEFFKGLRNYRIEYFADGEMHQSEECVVWLPENLDSSEVEDLINNYLESERLACP